MTRVDLMKRSKQVRRKAHNLASRAALGNSGSGEEESLLRDMVAASYISVLVDVGEETLLTPSKLRSGSGDQLVFLGQALQWNGNGFMCCNFPPMTPTQAKSCTQVCFLVIDVRASCMTADGSFRRPDVGVCFCP